MLRGLFVIGTLSVSAPALAGSVSGAGLAFGTEIEQAGFNFGYFLELDDSPWRVGGQLTPFFPNTVRDPTGFDTTTFLLSGELNAQRRIIDSDPAYVYLTGGLHLDFARSSFDFDDPDRENEAESDFGIGVSAGFGVDIDIGFSGIYLETSYVAVTGGFSQLVGVLGMRFWFS
ncbi:MAG: hypothetical protein AAFX94_19465 [Myxococcota bacterium]